MTAAAVVRPASSPDDRHWMRQAIELAERGWGRVHPNPLVGALVVQGDAVVGEGWHAEYGAAHAEAEPIGPAAPSLRDRSSYWALHHGRLLHRAHRVLQFFLQSLIFVSILLFRFYSEYAWLHLCPCRNK